MDTVTNHYLIPATQTITPETNYLYTLHENARRQLLKDLVTENSLIMDKWKRWKLLKRLPQFVDIKEGAEWVEDGTGKYLVLERDINVFVLLKWVKSNPEYFEEIV